MNTKKKKLLKSVKKQVSYGPPKSAHWPANDLGSVGLWGRTAVSQYAESIGYTSRARIFGKTETDSSQAK
jgi:hypothetical protein